MNTLFYIFIILFIIIEMVMITKAYSISYLSLKIKNYLKDKKEAEKEGRVFTENEEYKTNLIKITIYIVFFLIQWVFMFIGLMSKNSWPIFLFLALFPFLTQLTALILKFENIIFKTIISIFIKSIRISLMLFALLNSYHFKYDIMSLVYSYFK